MLKFHILFSVTLLGSCSAGPVGPVNTAGSSALTADAKAETNSAWLRDALLPVDRLTSSFQWRQRVTARFGDQTRSFEAVLSKHSGQLQLLGLGPMGTVGFVLSLSQSVGDSEPIVQFTNRSPITFPFDARFILLDVQRVFYPWFEAGVVPEGSRSMVVFGGTLTERWENHQLVERQFRQVAPRQRVSSAPEGSNDDVVISYHQWQPGLQAPERVELVNRRRGYELSIETLSQETVSEKKLQSESP